MFEDSTKNRAIELVKEKVANYKKLPKNLKNDKDVVLILVDKAPLTFIRLPENLRDDLDIVFAAIKREPRLLMYASERLRNNMKLRKYAFLLNRAPFIVDPEAFSEFEHLDKTLGRDFEKSAFYQRFRKLYRGEEISPEHMLNLEKWLLRNRKYRIIPKDQNKEL